MHIPGNGRRSIGRRMTALAGRWPIAAALLLVGMAVLLAPPAQSQAQTEVWSASITTGSADDSTIVGVWPDRSPPVGSITDRDFEYDGTTYTFTVIQVNSSGSLKIAMTTGFSQAAVDSLTFEAGNSSFALSDGTLSNSNSTVSWDSPGSSWSSGQTIAVKMVAQGATASADVTLREGGDGLPVGGDRMILEAFYDATGGDNWDNNARWKTDEVSWFGVETNRVGEVIGLELNDNNLTGTIPVGLADLSKLRTLKLGTNRFTGPIPTEFGDLLRLKYLHLHRNNLNGSIPAELGDLFRLVELRLYNNNLSGSIPTELGNLSKLEELWLYQNDLTGAIPGNLGSLGSLRWLQLSENRLSGSIPNQLGNLLAVKFFHLEDNKLTGSIPWQLGGLPLLEIIDLQRNELTGLIPTNFGLLPEILEIKLDNNELSGSIPTQLGDLSTLLLLDLHTNALTGSIPSQLGDLSELQYLYLGENRLSGSIPATLGSLDKLVRLDLEDNMLTGSIPADLGDMSKLERLNMSHNLLDGPLPAKLGELPKLERFWAMSNMGLSGDIPAAFKNLDKVIEMHLHHTGVAMPTVGADADFDVWRAERTVTTGTRTASSTITLHTDNTLPVGLWSDGTTLWVSDRDANKVFAYALDTGLRDEDSEFDLGGSNTHAQGIWSDGTTMWVADAWVAELDIQSGVGPGQRKLYAYQLADGTRDSAKDTFVQNPSRSIWSDEDTWWVVEANTSHTKKSAEAYEAYTDTRLADKDIDFVPAHLSPRGAWSDGTTLWVSDIYDEVLYGYGLADGLYDVFANQVLDPLNRRPHGMWSDGSLLWVADIEDAMVYVYTVPTDATLSSLTLEENDGTAITLTPAFASGTTTYSAGVANSVAEITIVPTESNDNAVHEIQGGDGTALTDANSTEEDFQVALLVGNNDIRVTVTAEDTSTMLTYTVTVTREMMLIPPAEVMVPNDWSLTPTGLATGDEFRLIFLSSTTHNGSSSDIGAYNTFIQGLAAAGHTDIRAYSAGFRVVGCTANTDAVDNTATTGTGVPIYWLSGNQVADDYADFYDGSWADEANDKDASGSNGPDTSQEPNYPFTGCGSTGVEATILNNSIALGKSVVRVGRPNSTESLTGPLAADALGNNTDTRPMYGLSQVFEVAASTVATLDGLALMNAEDDGTLELNEMFASTLMSYTADVGYGVMSITIEPETTNGAAMVTYLNASNMALADADTNTAGFQVTLGPGANTIKVKVTAEDTSTVLTYTVVVTRETAAPTVTISADKMSAVFKEDGITYTLTRSGLTTVAVPVTVTLTQTKDFLLAADRTQTVTIPAGQAMETFTVAASSFQPFAAGTMVEGGTLTAAVQDGSDYDLGSPSSVDVSVVIGVTVRIDQASYSVSEAAGFLTVKAIARTRPGAPQPTLNVSAMYFDFTDGTAIEFTDYSSVDGNTVDVLPSNYSLQGDGVWQAEDTYGINVTDDDLDEDNESFTLTLKYTNLVNRVTPLVDTSGNACGSVCTVTVTITDDDTAGVTVSESSLTVAEEDTTGDTYTVLLDSQPTADVTITIGGQSGTDVTAAPSPMTFTAVNWAMAQTVTVTADDDANLANETVSLTHAAESADSDYDSVTIADVTVTVNDNDTAQVMGLMVDTGNAQLVAQWTAVADATGYQVQWKSGGQSYNTSGRRAVIGSGSTTSHTIPNLTNGTEYTVRVRATRSGANPGPYSAEVMKTPLVPTAAGVTVSKSALTLTEQDATGDTYTVVLDRLPTASVTVMVGGLGSSDLTANPASLTFTTVNWQTARTVTVTAGNDADTTNDSVTLTHSATSNDTDYHGIIISGLTVTVEDNDTAQVMGVMVEPGDGQLAVEWTGVGNATGYEAQWKSGGQSYNDSGRQATISSGSTTSHTIPNLTNGTEYTVRVRATRTGANPGAYSAEVMKTPVLPTAAGVTVSESALTVTEEDATGDTYTVVLDRLPTADVTITIGGQSGTDVTAAPSPMTFTAVNWATAQTVTVTAGNDADLTNDSVTLTHSATSNDTDYHGIIISGLTVTVEDNDTAQVMGLMIEPGDGQLELEWTAVGNATGYEAQWKSGVQSYNNSRRAVIGSGSTTSHTIPNLTNGAEYTVRVRATRSGANPGAYSAEVMKTPVMPTAAGVTVSESALTVTEEDATGDTYTVVLNTQPTADVTVTVEGFGSSDVTANPSTLLFTTTDWNTAQTVTVTGGNDTDTANDSVTLTHAAASTDSDYDSVTIADVTVTVNDNDTAQVMGLMIDPGNAQLVAEWTAVANATGYEAQWKSGGQSYNTSDRQATISSGSTTSHTISSLNNGAEYTVRVRATRTGANPGAYSAEVMKTPVMPTAAGVTVSKTTVTVTEENATGDTYTVVLNTQPTANVTVTVEGFGSSDVTANPATLTFTTVNWQTARTVTVTAGDDADTANDSVTLTHAAASTDSDYDSVTIARVVVTVTDNDTARVKGVTVTPGDRSLVVRWTPVAKATGYKVQWRLGRQAYNTTDRQAIITSRFDHKSYHQQPRQRHRLRRAGDRDSVRRKRWPAGGSGDGEARGANNGGGFDSRVGPRSVPECPQVCGWKLRQTLYPGSRREWKRRGRAAHRRQLSQQGINLLCAPDWG